MTDPTSCCAAQHRATSAYCTNCDLLVGLEGFHVIGVDRGPDLLTVRVESAPGPVGCPACGVVASSRGRRARRLVDTPCFGTPVVLVCVKRTWACPEPACPTKTFSEIDESLAPPRSTWTTRARWWAVEQMRTEHACVAGLARQLGVAWDTTWAGIKPLLDAAAASHAPVRITAHNAPHHCLTRVRLPQVDHAPDRRNKPTSPTLATFSSNEDTGPSPHRPIPFIPSRSARPLPRWRPRNTTTIHRAALVSYRRTSNDGPVAGGMSKGTGIPLGLRGAQTRPDPTDRPWEQPGIGRRHCWVTPIGLSRREALLLAWDRADQHWLGLVVYVDDQGYPITGWVTSDRITPAS